MGALDSYFNGIRNYLYPAEIAEVRLLFNSMVANDIENVSISGL